MYTVFTANAAEFLEWLLSLFGRHFYDYKDRLRE